MNGAWRRRRGWSAFWIFLSLLFLRVLPASAQRPPVRFSQGGRANLRDEQRIRSEILGRFEADLVSKSRLHLIPFLEARWDLDRSSWSRVELGGEMGVQLLPWFYAGHGIHQAWLSPERDRPEWEIRTLVHIPLSLLKINRKPVGLYVLNEYTYDLREGRGVRNEVAAGFKVPLPVPRLSAMLGWRHVDPVHFPDMDQLEASLQAEF